MNNDNNLTQVDALFETAVMLLEKQQEKHSGYAEQTRREFVSLLEETKRELTGFSKESVKTELDSVLKGYAEDMEQTRQAMLEQVKEFNTYLLYVNKKNRQLAFQSWLAVLLSLAVVLIGGVWAAYYYSQIVSKNKADAEIAQLISQSDLVRCGDSLCAKTGKAQKNGYRPVLKHQAD